MIKSSLFYEMLAKRARVPVVNPEDVLFGSGINIGSLVFAEFIMEVEEETDTDIEVADLDASIVTAGQLFERIKAITERQR